jgi:flavin-dependent dehydrogenase
MRVAIMGCGPGGSYLYRLLAQRRPDIEGALFDVQPDTRCGVKSCGWGVSLPVFAALCREVAFNPDDYVLALHRQAVVETIVMKANLAIINKPLFIEHLIGTADIKASAPQLGDYERIIDATGRRAYLGQSRQAAYYYDAVETRIELRHPLRPTAFVNTLGGYSWVVPLGDGTAHLGSLSPWGKGEVELEVERTRRRIDAGLIVCECSAPICCAGPATPFVTGNIWGLGESIGLVDPVIGAGITPAMDSARIMVETWDAPAAYTRQVLRRYAYMSREARVVRGLVHGGMPKISDIPLFRRVAHQVRIYPDLGQIIKLLGLASSVLKANRSSRNRQALL